MALHDFTMQQWWMESLTAKIIAFFIRITRILGFFFFLFLLNDCPQRGANLHQRANGASLKSCCEFLFQALCPKDATEHERKMAELDQHVRSDQLFNTIWCCSA